MINIYIEMSENEETSSSARVKGAEEVLKKANLKEEKKEDRTDKSDIKEDATSEE
jgi:hypothetical protein